MWYQSFSYTNNDCSERWTERFIIVSFRFHTGYKQSYWKLNVDHRQMYRNGWRLRSNQKAEESIDRFINDQNKPFQWSARQRCVAKKPYVSSTLIANSAIIPALAFSPASVDTLPYSVKMNLNRRESSNLISSSIMFDYFIFW